MLRVGLTGGLGSGKSTVAKMLGDRGAYLFESDAMGRELMMQRDSVLRNAIVARFGDQVLRPDGQLDRIVLARIAFAEGRVEELNAIVHPAVVARQAELIDRIAERTPAAVVVIESALIFETKHGGPGGWRRRFDCVVLVTAPEDVRIARYIERMTERGLGSGLSPQAHAEEARKRMAYQLCDETKIAMSDFVIRNEGSVFELRSQVDPLWQEFAGRARGTDRKTS